MSPVSLPIFTPHQLPPTCMPSKSPFPKTSPGCVSSGVGLIQNSMVASCTKFKLLVPLSGTNTCSNSSPIDLCLKLIPEPYFPAVHSTPLTKVPSLPFTESEAIVPLPSSNVQYETIS